MTLNNNKNLVSSRGVFFPLVFAFLALIPLMSNAATLTPQQQEQLKKASPDAGRVLQEIERGIKAQPFPELPKVEDQESTSQDDAIKVTVKEFKFEGNHVLTSTDLLNALEPLMNREITLTQLKSSLDIIAALYQARGFLATATLPEQDITDGLVQINIVEAIFGGTKFKGEAGKDFSRIRPGRIESIVANQSPVGKPLDQAGVDRALALVQRMSGFSVTANYQLGQTDGTTDLLATVKDKNLLTASLSADNSGGRYTGWDKQMLGIGLQSPLRLGDQLDFTTVHSRGTDYLGLAYKMPVGASGLQLGVNASYMEYEFVVLLEGNLQPYGRSSSFGWNASYPMYLSRTSSVISSLSADQKHFVNRTRQEGDVAKVSDYKVNVVSYVLSGSHFDNFLAGAQTSASLDFGFGVVDYDRSPGDSKQNDKDGANTQGHFKRLKWNINRNQFLTDTWSLNFDLTGQAADRNLDSSEKFYLGGMTGVRAYPTSEGSGSDGYLAKLELKKYLPWNFSMSAFVDSGYIRQYHITTSGNGDSPLPAEETSPNAYRLEGRGLTVAWNGPYNASVKATYAHRFGHNPNPITGTKFDQNGLLEEYVLWLNGSIAF